MSFIKFMTQTGLSNMSINNLLKLCGTMVLGIIFQGYVYALSLDNVEYSSLPGERVQINLMFSESLGEEPVNFTIDNPARIAIDLPEVELNL